jgi:hypothetical protein
MQPVDLSPPTIGGKSTPRYSMVLFLVDGLQEVIISFALCVFRATKHD